MIHDYKRHGTTTLSAALDVRTGLVIGDVKPRHRAKEFLSFLPWSPPVRASAADPAACDRAPPMLVP